MIQNKLVVLVLSLKIELICSDRISCFIAAAYRNIYTVNIQNYQHIGHAVSIQLNVEKSEIHLRYLNTDSCVIRVIRNHDRETIIPYAKRSFFKIVHRCP